MSCSVMIIFIFQSVVTGGQFSDLALSVIPSKPEEGSDMTIICSVQADSNRNNTGMTFAFSKNGQVVQEFGSNNKYIISSVTPKHSGNYTCDVKTLFSGPRKTTKHVKVQELFSAPEIEVSHYPVAEGSNVTITCSSSSSCHSAVLQFAFLRNGQHVKEFSSSKEYQMYKIQLNDSGNYTCEVRRRDDKVKKISQMFSIHVQASRGNKDQEEMVHADSQYIQQKHIMAALILATVLSIIIGSALLFKYRQKCSTLFTGQHSHQSAPVLDRDSAAREDLHYAHLNFMKDSLTADTGVTYSVLKTNTHLTSTIPEDPLKSCDIIYGRSPRQNISALCN